MDIKQESQTLEHILNAPTKDHSAFHAELHKIQELDSKNGTLNVDQYHRDMAAIEKQLQADGYLPKLKLFLDNKRPSDNGSTRAEADKPHEAGNPRIEPTGGKLYEMHGLKHATGEYATPDAMVLLPKDFDPNKPIHLVVYNHGWNDNVKTAYESTHLAEQMAKAPPNTVLIVPEWQISPHSSGTLGGEQGAFADKNFVSGMVQDIFDKTPELKNKTLADVDQIGIISHSAGFNPTKSELDNNEEFSKKVNSVTLLDSLYKGDICDNWLKANINDLSAGRKHFHNIFTGGTAPQSKAQAERIKGMLRDAHLSTDSVSTDYQHDREDEKSGHLIKHSIVFRSTATEHPEIPKRYPRIIEAAANGDDTV